MSETLELQSWPRETRETEGPRPPAQPRAAAPSAATSEPAVCTRGGEYQRTQIACHVAAVRIRAADPVPLPASGVLVGGLLPTPPTPTTAGFNVQFGVCEGVRSEPPTPGGGLRVHINSHRPADTLGPAARVLVQPSLSATGGSPFFGPAELTPEARRRASPRARVQNREGASLSPPGCAPPTSRVFKTPIVFYQASFRNGRHALDAQLQVWPTGRPMFACSGQPLAVTGTRLPHVPFGGTQPATPRSRPYTPRGGHQQPLPSIGGQVCLPSRCEGASPHQTPQADGEITAISSVMP